MLFDLRSKGRRRTVQGVYLVLALILGGGLVLFGVGNGNGIGGLLNAFNGSGNGGAASAFVSKQEKAAVRQTKLHPQDPAAWSALVRARYSAASQGSNFNTSTSTYTASGKKVLAQVTQAWEKYVTLAKKPDSDLAVLAARAYDTTGNFKKEAATWQIVTAANPRVSTYYQYLALAAWQAKNSNLGDLAEEKAIALLPKSQRSTLKQQLDQQRSAILGPSATPTTPTTATTTTPASTTTTPASGSSKKRSSGKQSSGAKSSAKSKSHK
jgi:hypothetical protein